MRPIPPEIRDAILRELREGARGVNKRLAEKYGLHRSTITNIGREGGICFADHRLALTDAQAAEVVARYAAGESTPAIAPSMRVTESTVQLTLRRAGVIARSQPEATRRIAARHDALDVLTPDAAYWCGFLFADGSVQLRPNASPLVSVTLKASDRDHLVKLRDFLGSEHAIGYRAPKPMVANGVRGQSSAGCRYALASQRLGDRLIALGRYGPAVDRELAASRDFWRGVVDGDGTVATYRGLPSFKVVGEHWLLSAFLGFFGSTTQRLSVRPLGKIHQISTRGAVAARIVDRLYAGATVALDRKAVAAAAILAAKDGRPSA